MQFGGRPATNSALGKRVAKSDCEVDDLLENCPISSTPTVMRASRFLVACQNGQSLSAFSSWSKYMRLRVNLRESKLLRALQSNISDRGKPGKPSGSS